MWWSSCVFLCLQYCGAGVFSLLTQYQRPTLSFRRITPSSALETTTTFGSNLFNNTATSFDGPADKDQDFSAYLYDDYRYGLMEPLLQWAVNSGVEFAHGTEIVADDRGDWGVELVESKGTGTPILTIPQELILTSRHFQGTRLERWMSENIENVSLLPECILTVILLEELSAGGASPWNIWLESLPTEYFTGLFLDSFERSIVRRMAPKHLQRIEQQWSDCSAVITKLARDPQSILTPYFRTWLQTQDNLLFTARWAFSVITTRSWRTPDGQHATIVPIGDMVNHHCQQANVRPCFRNGDGAMQLCLTTDIHGTTDWPKGIHLSYGTGHHPARFLVNFGFCDTSAPLIDAHIDHYLSKNGLPPLSDETNWPVFDPSLLVVSKDHGVAADGVWLIFLLIVLRRRNPSQIPRVQEAYDSDDDVELGELLDGLFGDWELTVAMEMKDHFVDLLVNVYPDFQYSKNDFIQHPRLDMITNYNGMMRTIFQRAIAHLNLVVEQASKDLVQSREKGQQPKVLL